MLNKEQSDILSTLDNLFELSEDNTTKKAIIEASKTFINHINMTAHEHNHEVLKNHSSEELRGILVNLIKYTFGSDAKIEIESPCCPPGSCGVCIKGICVEC